METRVDNSTKPTYVDRLLNEKSNRVNLNDLLQRAKEEKKNQNKVSVLICSCVAVVAGTVILIFSF